MTEFAFDKDGWLEGDLDDADDAATFTRLRIRVDSTIVTRNFSKRGGGESEAINVPLLPLAISIAKYWWRLLYEPLRGFGDDRRFQAHHRLDVPMHGYVFPAFAICSAGDEAILVDWAIVDQEYSPLKFLTPQPHDPIQMARTTVETSLADLVESAISRLRSSARGSVELRDNWQRVQDSMSNRSELAYCEAAGRMGLDPYDEEAPDLERPAGEVPPSLFNDIADAVDVNELADATAWSKELSGRLKRCPKIDVEAFGQAPADDVSLPAWSVGSRAAKQLRKKLGLHDLPPKKAVNQFLGMAVSTEHALTKRSPESLTALIRRSNGSAFVGTVAQSARQQRFRGCMAAYLGWIANADEDRAGTIALTRRQQASRAFAAEFLAPQEMLKDRAGEHGFTVESIESTAGDLIAPYETVLWQSYRAGIRLRGVDLPFARQPRIL